MKKQLLFICLASFSILAAAQHQAYIDIGNVRALVNSNGLLFHDTATNRAVFEVPKGDSLHSIFASALWITSMHQRNGLPHYSFGYDAYGYSDFNVSDLFKPGPVDLINQQRDTTARFQRLWKIDKDTIDDHISNWNQPNYQIPTSILEWPGNGNSNTTKILAPFNDLDGDSIYEPQQGEYPLIKGDQAIYLITNNFKSPLADTGYTFVRDSIAPWIIIDSMASGTFGYTQTEVHYLIYGYNSAQKEIANTVFVNLKIFNRSNKPEDNLKDFNASIFTEFSNGNRALNFIGTDTIRNMYYGYNSGRTGNAPTLPKEFGAQGIKFLSIPIKQSMKVQYNWNAVQGNFEFPITVRNAQLNLWKNGKRLRSGGNGFNTCIDSTSEPKFMFPSDIAMPRDSSHWSDLYPCYQDSNLVNTPDLKRMIGTPNLPSQFNNRTSIEFDYAYVFAQDTGGVVASVAALQVAADSVQAFYDRNRFVGINENTTSASLEFHIYPNPASEEVFIETDQKLFNVELFNLEGRMMSQFATTKRLDVSNLPNGIYFIQISSEDKVGVRRLVIHK